MTVLAWLVGVASASSDCDRPHGVRGFACTVVEVPVPRVSALTVDATPNGGIEVTGGNQDPISVSAVVRAQAGSDDAARAAVNAVRIEVHDGRISATGPAHGDWSVSYKVTAPASTDLDLRTVNGPLAVTGIDADVTLTSENGPISVSHVNGSVHGRTVNGPLSVTLDGAGWRGAGLELATDAGPVSLDVPKGYAAVFDVTTELGPATRPPASTAGAPPVHLTTQVGPVSVRVR